MIDLSRRIDIQVEVAAVAFLALASMGFGAAVYDIVLKATSPAPIAGFRYLYYSDVKGERTFSIDAEGNAEFGPKYNRATEASKLIEMLRTMKNGGITPDCHETGYRPPARLGDFPIWFPPRDGVLQVSPGDASPPPPRIEWRF